MLPVELISDAFLLLFASLIANQAKVCCSGQTESSQNRCSRPGIVVQFSSAFIFKQAQGDREKGEQSQDNRLAHLLVRVILLSYISV